MLRQIEHPIENSSPFGLCFEIPKGHLGPPEHCGRSDALYLLT
jgi:hypothetical protein